MGVILSVHKAQKSIGARVLFQNLTFGLNQGDRTALVGPNGAGKSTLMKCLADLDHLDQGAITWSQSIKRVYVSQSPIYKKDETVRDFLGNTDNEAHVWELLSKLRSQVYDLDLKFSDLSGGEQKKFQIIQAFIKKPDVILMDEPTNHLDVESIQALEEFLESQHETTFFIISHDRLFLQNVVKEIMDLDARYKDGFLKIKGGYAEYLEISRDMFRAQNVQQERLENDLRRETAWLRRGAKARQTKQKARQDSAHELAAEVDLLNELNRKRVIDINLKSDDRIPKKLIEVENLSVARGDKLLFENLNLLIHRRTRLGLLGANGSGKSTLIKVLLEVDPSIKIISGKISKYEDLKYSYFEQQRNLLDFDKTLMGNICPDGDYVFVHGQPIHAKSYLDRFRFRRDQHELKVKELSGGEQNRLLIAKLMTEKTQLMILDEPTNDLDFETLESLRKSLAEFDGAVILVSHDRAFMDEVCDQILVFTEGSTELITFSSFLQWQDWKIAKESETQEAIKKEKAAKNNKSNKLTYKEQREFDSLESVILQKENDLKSLQEQIQHSENATDAKKLAELSAQISSTEKEIESMYQRWTELETKSGQS